MRNFVDITALCREYLHKKHLEAGRYCYINCLQVRSIATTLYGKDKEAGFAIDGNFFFTIDNNSADKCVQLVIDIVTEIQETHHLEYIDTVNTRIGKTLREVIKEERETEGKDK